MYRRAKTFAAGNIGFFILGVIGFAVLWNLLLPHRPTDTMSTGVLVWWCALWTVSVINIHGWRLSAAALVRRQAAVAPDVYRFQRWQLILSAVYVVGCAFRSVLPRADVQRLGLFDSWVSSVMVGRSVATVAELCFMAQWALLLNRVARDAGSRPFVIVSWLLVPLIAIAEICSWSAVLTTCYLGNAFEESLWALSATLMVIAFVALWSRCAASYRPFVAVAIVLGIAYVTFMVTVDVPMYVSRWLTDEASGRAYLSIGQGLHDVGSRWTISYAWEEWRSEIPWMSLYFSVGVWCSIALVYAPRVPSDQSVEAADVTPSGLIPVRVESGGMAGRE